MLLRDQPGGDQLPGFPILLLYPFSPPSNPYNQAKLTKKSSLSLDSIEFHPFQPSLTLFLFFIFVELYRDDSLLKYTRLLLLI